MSSLAATQADGFYVPPEYFSSGAYKKTSRNAFAGSKGHNQYLTSGVVRFELPYDAWCLNKGGEFEGKKYERCGVHIKRGTRFNAAKAKVGIYTGRAGSSTENVATSQTNLSKEGEVMKTASIKSYKGNGVPIYEFRISCRHCSYPMRIQTDPANRTFACISGIKWKKMAPEDSMAVDTGENSSGWIGTREDGKIAESSALEKLERKNDQELVIDAGRVAVSSLMGYTARMETDADMNALARKKMRKDRPVGTLVGSCGSVALLPVNSQDEEGAKKQFKEKVSRNGWREAERITKKKMKDVRSGSIFSQKNVNRNSKDRKVRTLRDKLKRGAKLQKHPAVPLSRGIGIKISHLSCDTNSNRPRSVQKNCENQQQSIKIKRTAMSPATFEPERSVDHEKIDEKSISDNVSPSSAFSIIATYSSSDEDI